MKKYFIFGFALALLLVACRPANIAPTFTVGAPEQQIVITVTASPQPTETQTPTFTPTATETPLPTHTPTPVAYGPENFPDNVDPLTGLIVSDPKILDRRPVAVKINIVPRRSNRPAWGLSFADIVYDYYHNDGYSRFHAIFYGKDADLAGPIRSGRLLDYELVHMYQSIFVYGSADALINHRLMNSDFSDRLVLEHYASDCPPTGGTPLCRYEPNTKDILLGNTATISKYMASNDVDNSRQNLDGMTFNEKVQSNGVPGEKIYVRYSSDNYTRWDYDASTGSYLRFQDSVWDQGQGEEYEPLTDRLNEKQITAANVVVIEAPHVYYQEPPAEIVEILLSGTGKAYAYRDGQMYEVNWDRPTTNSVLSLTNDDGTAFPFKPGTTWFQVISDYTETQKLEDGAWRFDFVIPRS
jgi:hypothetical protein